MSEPCFKHIFYGFHNTLDKRKNEKSEQICSGVRLDWRSKNDTIMENATLKGLFEI